MHEDQVNTRKSLLINPKFQIHMMVLVAALAAIVIGIFYAADFYFFSRFISQGHALGLPPDHVFFQFISQQRSTMNRLFLVTALGAFAVVFIAGLVLSHRVAGPVHRLRNHMLDIAAGKHLNAMKFREKDYFPELAEAYNQQLDFFRKKS